MILNCSLHVAALRAAPGSSPTRLCGPSSATPLYGNGHFRNQIHHPEAMAYLLPYGFIQTPFCRDLDHAIFKPGYTLPKLWQICVHMASFGHLSVQISINPFSKTDTPPQSYGRFASIWLHLDKQSYLQVHFLTLALVW